MLMFQSLIQSEVKLYSLVHASVLSLIFQKAVPLFCDSNVATMSHF